MTDRTDFTDKPRTPAEKIRELEERVDALEGRKHRHEVQPGERYTSTDLCEPVIYGPRPAEPPGSPTVIEEEDRPIEPIDLTPEQQKRIAAQWWQQVPVEAEDPVRGWHPDQPRRECWILEREDGSRVYFDTEPHISTPTLPPCSKHHLVELRDGEEIVSDKALAEIARALYGITPEQLAETIELARRLVVSGSRDKWLEAVEQHESVVSERDQLKTRVAELEALLLNNKALAERVAELENAARRVSARLNEQRSVLHASCSRFNPSND